MFSLYDLLIEERILSGPEDAAFSSTGVDNITTDIKDVGSKMQQKGRDRDVAIM